MLRGFRHTLFLMLQVGVLFSGGLALVLWPDAWRPVALCVAGSFVASLFCERMARRYLRKTLGQLRRAADEISRGNPNVQLEAHRGDDFYKLVNSINHASERLADGALEQQRLQDELRRRERLAFLGELAASVAHEVNNPLDGVQNCARILRRSLSDPQRTTQMLDLIDGGLERIEAIVRRLLTLAKQNVIRASETRLRTVIESAIENTHARIEARGIRIVRDFAEEDDRASVDPLLLEQVFVNLLINAADSMPDAGDITISIRREPIEASVATSGETAVLRVDVTDTGEGIPPDVLPHVFEPFYTTKGGERGTGLGLAIAARIVDAHRGTIVATPREQGGTVLTVRIPAIENAIGSAEVASATASDSVNS